MLSDANGDPTQFFLNLPFGEMMTEQTNGAYNNPYKFNDYGGESYEIAFNEHTERSSELDQETGFYYYAFEEKKILRKSEPKKYFLPAPQGLINPEERIKKRYYNPRTSVWLSVDPIAVYNPVYEVEHYIDGQHNGGVYNSMNLDVYGYTYKNPIIYVDPNGKQVNVTNTAFVYYVGPDGFDGLGLLGHTSIGVSYDFVNYGGSNGYAALSGNSEATREIKTGFENETYTVVDESNTIKNYLDSGEIVERYHYKLEDKVISALAEAVDGSETYEIGGAWCTGKAATALYNAFFESGFSQDKANERTNKIIYYSLPEELGKSEVLETGSVRYDEFYKEDGKYYLDINKYDKVNEKWSTQKVEIEFKNYKIQEKE